MPIVNIVLYIVKAVFIIEWCALPVPMREPRDLGEDLNVAHYAAKYECERDALRELRGTPVRVHWSELLVLSIYKRFDIFVKS